MIKEVHNGNTAEKYDENKAWKTVFHNRQSHFLVQTSSGAEEGGCCPFVRFPNNCVVLARPRLLPLSTAYKKPGKGSLADLGEGGVP